MEQPKHRAPEHPIHDELSCGKKPMFYTDTEARHLKSETEILRNALTRSNESAAQSHQAAAAARETRDEWARHNRKYLLEQETEHRTKLRATKRGAFVAGLLIGALFATIMVTYVGWAIGAF